MKRDKKQRLERAVWTVAGTREFLALSGSEARLIELKQVPSPITRDRAGSEGATRTERGDEAPSE